MEKKLALVSLLFLGLIKLHSQNLVSDKKDAGAFPLLSPGQTTGILVTPKDDSLAQIAARLFQDTALSFEQRVNDLISRLTLEEKVAQMLNTTPAIERLGIPAYDWWNEILHGAARTPYHVTVYPQAIAMAATFDTNSIKTMAD